MPVPDGFVVLAKLGAAHGLRGDVKLEIRTDDPGRLAVGASVITDDALVGELTIARRCVSSGAQLIAFDQVGDRTDAEALTGLLLLGPTTEEEDAWYPSELVGLEARSPQGRVLGEVIAVQDSPAHHLLEVREPSGARTLVPFVEAIVPHVDKVGGVVTVDAPGGLFEDAPSQDESDQSDESEVAEGTRPREQA